MTINAQELRFEDISGNSYLSTTPVDHPVARPPQSQSGVYGLKAGDVRLNIGSFHAAGTAKRLIMTGWEGSELRFGQGWDRWYDDAVCDILAWKGRPKPIDPNPKTPCLCLL